jgi:hypothetical protein
MSLINDALKRARDLHRKDPPPGSPPLTPFEARKREDGPGWILPVVIIVLIVAALFFVAFALIQRGVKKIVNVPEISETQEVETAAASPPPPVIGPAAITNDVSPVSPHVQGIAYGSAHPWAIIDGRTVFIGDRVGGMRVKAISRSSVSLVGNGQTNTLVVGQ